MAPSSRDRISVDLRGLGPALLELARARGVTPSDLVRSVLAAALDDAESPRPGSWAAAVPPTGRVRLSLRMTAEQARGLAEAARCAGLPVGAFVVGLAAGVPVLAGGSTVDDHVAALVASSAELSTLHRNIRHLSDLLRQAASRAAQEYRQMLDTLNADVRRHLALASTLLADLRPARARQQADSHSSR